ncbi:MAG: helix-turn-helix domain-containing protein [Acidimicrobiales bacterium]
MTIPWAADTSTADGQDVSPADRILDGAARIYAERGMVGADMATIAEEAGYSRATVYRYFESREALQRAFVEREARRIADVLQQQFGHLPTRDRVVEAFLTSLEMLRSDPVLSAFIARSTHRGLAELVESPEIVGAIARTTFGDGADETADGIYGARWLTRALVSLLIAPGHDAADERRMIADFVRPALDTGTGELADAAP